MKKNSSRKAFVNMKDYFVNLFDRDPEVFAPRPDVVWIILRVIFGLMVIAVFWVSLVFVEQLRQMTEEGSETDRDFTEQDLGQAREIVTGRLRTFENLQATSVRAVDPAR